LQPSGETSLGPIKVVLVFLGLRVTEDVDLIGMELCSKLLFTECPILVIGNLQMFPFSHELHLFTLAHREDKCKNTNQSHNENDHSNHKELKGTTFCFKLFTNDLLLSDDDLFLDNDGIFTEDRCHFLILLHLSTSNTSRDAEVN
jgi:hypothetical protein